MMSKLYKKVSLLVVVILALAGCTPGFQRIPTPTPTLDPDNPEFTIVMDEFRFTPDHIRLVVGQTVTMHVVNKGQELHEIMIGRNPLRSEDGHLDDGFEHDFFALTDVSVQGDVEVMGMNGEGMDMGMDMGMETAAPESSMDMDMGTATPEGAMDMGEEMSSEEDGHGEEGHGMGGGMVMIDPEKEATITFTVTKEMAGAWTMGCFEGGDLKHLDLGMAGILYVRDFGE